MEEGISKGGRFDLVEVGIDMVTCWDAPVGFPRKIEKIGGITLSYKP